MKQLIRTGKTRKTRRAATTARTVRHAARRRRDGDTEQRILDAAHAVFVRRGTAGARMQEIAAEAGVNQALLHYYFRSKEQLARGAFERAGSQLMPAIIRVMASDAPLEEKVEQVVALELDHLSRAPYLPGYIIGEVAHHPERAQQLIAAMTHGLTPDDIRPRVFGALRRQIDERVAAGTLRAISAESFVVNLMSLCIFPFAARPMLQAMLAVDEAGFNRFIARRRRDLVEFFLGALRS
ncbi:MAG TPA: TetR/AcrR family transcriptional regulator [Vicinamibacterales bacterium]|nr:TetR/AcrR family transcriptional regulator [Vicinamibacterales bacterium]